MPSLQQRFPREYDRYRTLFSGDFQSFDAYLRHRGILPPLASRPISMQTEEGRIINQPIDPNLWPTGTIREVEFKKTKKYKKEKRWVYNPIPTIVFDDEFNPPPPPPPPPAGGAGGAMPPVVWGLVQGAAPPV